MDILQSYSKISSHLILTLLLISSSNLIAGGEKDYVSVSAALFDVLQNSHSSFESRIEYRLSSVDWVAKPIAGFMANTDGARYFYSGLFTEIFITNYISLIPSLATGIYFQNFSKNLHFLLEFKSQLDIIITFPNEFKAGFSFDHISNASLGKENPGVESLAFTVQIPVDW